MGKQCQDQHQGFNSSLSWSRDDESTFLDMLVEEFISKQPEAMDALAALVLCRISKITDDGWKRVAIRLNKRTGKEYTMMELEEQMKRFSQRSQCMENLFTQGGSAMDIPWTPFEPYLEQENDTTVHRSTDENISTPEKDATSCDGCNVSVSDPEDCVRNSNGSSGKVSYQDSDTGIDFPRTAFKQSSESENDSGISWSPSGNLSISEKEGRNSNEINFNVPGSEENITNSDDKSCGNLSYQESGHGLDFPCANLEPYFEYYIDAGIYQSPDVSQQEDGPNVEFSHATSEPYVETGVRNSNRNSPNGSHQDNSPGILRSPSEQCSIPEKEGRDSDLCNGSVPYPDGSVGNSNKSCGNVSHQEGGPRSKFELSDEHENDARICQSPVGSVSTSFSDGSNGSVSYPEEGFRNSNRSCDDVSYFQEVDIDSGVVSKKSSTSNAENNCGSARECENVSSPLGNVESSSQQFDSASGQEEEATSSTPRNESLDTEISMRCKRSPAADSLDSGDYKRNKWSSYSQAESTCEVQQNPDDAGSFSVARCRNILHGMRRINDQFRDTALDLLEDPYYRKFFMKMKHDKRLDWLNSMMGMKH